MSGTMHGIRPKHEIKTCPRCGLDFECKLNNPVHCGCARVHLSDDLLLRIQEQYPDCLCTACLNALGAGAGLDPVKRILSANEGK